MKFRWLLFSMALLLLIPVQVMARGGGHHGAYGEQNGYGPGEMPGAPSGEDNPESDIPGYGMGDPPFLGEEFDENNPMGGFGMREHAAYQEGGPARAGMQHFPWLEVSTEEDPFVHPGRFSEVTGGMAFVDENEDGLADIVQNTDLFHSYDFGEFVDENGDSIHDPFETWEMYHELGMRNFVDVDGDGICDNYVDGAGVGIGSRGQGFRWYENLDVDLSEDVFIHPGRFSEVTGGLAFVDENEDGIADIVQNTDLFHSYDFGEFVDENGDSIHDPFETWEMYHELGMRNFVDVDGDGLCDNYQQLPVE